MSNSCLVSSQNRKIRKEWVATVFYVACTHLARHLTTMFLLSRHIEAKHLNLRLECKFCHVVLRTRLNLQRHPKKKHSQTRENINEIMTYHLEETDFDTDTSLLQ